MNNNIDVNLFFEEAIPFACPRCPRGLVNKFNDDGKQGWHCDKCGTEWEDDLDLRKEHVSNFLNEILKSNNKARVIVDYNCYELIIKSIKYTEEEITEEDSYIQYLENTDRLDEMYDYANCLIDKFGIEAEYYDLTDPENPMEVVEITGEDVKDFEDLIDKAQLIPFPTNMTMDGIEFSVSGDGDKPYDCLFLGYVVDDFDFAKVFNRLRPEFYVYTLVEGDNGEMYIIDGAHLVNRLGYCFGLKKIENVDIIY